MVDRIKELEKISRLLEPTPELRKSLLEKVTRYSEEFLNSVSSLKTYNVTEDNGKEIFNFDVSDSTKGITDVLSILKKSVDTPGINPASGGHLGYIPGGGIYHSALGDFLADITNRYAGVFFASPGAVRMENHLLNWMSEIIGYPKTSGGNLTSGGSISNLIAIVTAREAFKIKSKEVEKTVIYLTAQTHHSVEKSLRIAGLNECVKHYIPVDKNFILNLDELENSINQDKKNGLKPWLIVSSAGTTDVGAVDPLEEIGIISDKHNLWHHVDAAYGAFFILSKSGKEILKGIKNSDSIIMDPHKGLFLPYGSGAVLIKDKKLLYKAFGYQAGYMQDALARNEELSPADLSPELSKPFRGLRLWLPLMLLGTEPFSAALEEKLQLAQYAYSKLKEFKNIELGPKPTLSVITFRIVPPEGDANIFNKKLMEEIHKDGRVFLSSTILNGRYTLRMAILSFRTHLIEIDLALQILKEKIQLLSK